MWLIFKDTECQLFKCRRKAWIKLNKHHKIRKFILFENEFSIFGNTQLIFRHNGYMIRIDSDLVKYIKLEDLPTPLDNNDTVNFQIPSDGHTEIEAIFYKGETK